MSKCVVPLGFANFAARLGLRKSGLALKNRMLTRSCLSLVIVSPLECLYLGPDLVLHAQTSKLVLTETKFGLQVGFMLLFALLTDSLHFFLLTESLIF